MSCVVMPQEQLPRIQLSFCLPRLGKTRAAARMLIIISFGLSLVAALIAGHPSAASARLP